MPRQPHSRAISAGIADGAFITNTLRTNRLIRATLAGCDSLGRVKVLIANVLVGLTTGADLALSNYPDSIR